MDALEGRDVGLALSDQTSNGLTIETGHDETSNAGSLEPMSEGADGDITDDSKDLPRLIIQERLEETSTGAEPESTTIQSDDYDVENCKKGANDSKVTISLEDPSVLCLNNEAPVGIATAPDQIKGDEQPQERWTDPEQPAGYVVYNFADKTLQVGSSEVTPLLVLANSAEKGMYEANVVLSQSSGISPVIKLQSQAPAGQNVTTPITRVSPSEPARITMALQSGSQLLVDGPKTSDRLLYICDIEECGSAFGSLAEYQQHQVSCHSATPADGTGVFQVDANPLIAATVNRALVCPFEGCGRTFAWPAHLKYHQLTHTGRRMYKCEEEGCGASFYTVQRLTVHRRTHTGERPFACTEPGCGRAFTTQGNLKNHMRIHSGEKPFVCEFIGCNRRFAEHSSLRKHTHVHTGAKPFKCEVCGKKFSQSGSRNVHMKRHQNVIEEDVQAKSAVVAGGTNLVVRLPNEKVLVLQQTRDDLLPYQDLQTTEPVVFSNAVTDHVVTVTTQPAECDGESLPSDQTLTKADELGSQDAGNPHHSDLGTPTTGANVVVLSQPEEMVAMAPGYHHEGEESTKDLVYSCDHLLNVDVT